MPVLSEILGTDSLRATKLKPEKGIRQMNCKSAKKPAAEPEPKKPKNKK
jgi:hypothetical protein